MVRKLDPGPLRPNGRAEIEAGRSTASPRNSPRGELKPNDRAEMGGNDNWPRGEFVATRGQFELRQLELELHP